MKQQQISCFFFFYNFTAPDMSYITELDLTFTNTSSDLSDLTAIMTPPWASVFLSFLTLCSLEKD